MAIPEVLFTPLHPFPYAQPTAEPANQAALRARPGGPGTSRTEAVPSSPAPPVSPPVPLTAPEAVPVALAPARPAAIQTPFQIGLEKALAAPEAATTGSPLLAENLTGLTTAEAMEVLPAMFQMAYRAIHAARPEVLASAQALLPPWEYSHLYVEQTNALTPLNDREAHHAFHSKQPAHPALPPEDLTEEAAAAYHAQVAPALDGRELPPAATLDVAG